MVDEKMLFAKKLFFFAFMNYSNFQVWYIAVFNMF